MMAKDRSGFALIISLWIMLILTVIAMSFSFRMRLEMKMAGYSRDSLKALAAADAGIERAVAEIRTFSDAPCMLLEDSWRKNKAYDDVRLGDGTYRVWTADVHNPGKTCGVVDEESKLNLNFMLREEQRGHNAEEMLKHIPGIDAALAASIMDWMDEPAETYREGGAEDDYYLGGPGYECKDAPLDTVEELLLVKGMSPGKFYGEDFNGNGGLDPGEDKDGSGGLDPGIKDYVTVYTSGEINLNTASKPVIQAALGIGEDIADYIVRYRETMGGFKNMEEVQKVFNELIQTMSVSAGTTKELGEAITGGKVTCKSSVFTVNSTGSVRDGKLARTVKAVVKVSGGGSSTVYRREI